MTLPADRRVPLVVGFDVEPDGLDIPRHERRPWTGFERTMEIANALRPRLADALDAPVRFSWFLRMDPQIKDVYGSTTWAAETYGAELDTPRAHGDEVGLHPHTLRWREGRGGWVAAVDDDSWVQECVRVSFDSYQSAFGEQCQSHRFGDGFMSESVVGVLRELDVRADLTLEPGRPSYTMESIDGPLPDQFDVPRVPFRPDPTNFRQPARAEAAAGEQLWMLPLASADPDRALPAARRLGRRLRHRGRPKHRPVLLWAPWPSRLLWDIVARDVDAGALTVLPFIVRADTLLRADWAGRFESHLVALGSHPLGRRAALVTPSAVVADLESTA